MIRPDVVLYAKLHGYDRVESVGKWRGYDAYQPSVNLHNGKAPRVGMPYLILAKGPKLRLTTADECWDYMKEKRQRAS